MPYKDPVAQREFNRVWIARRRSEWLAANGPCAKCGSVELLEVDHIDPTMKVDHRIWSWSAARRAVELAKCQVLCSECHHEKTRTARPPLQHGTNSVYVWRRCRCDDCRAAHAATNRKYR